jgi:hypothetical protein
MFIVWIFCAVSMVGGIVMGERDKKVVPAVYDMACSCRDDRGRLIDPFEIKEARK